jgi:hypothetical protein
MTPSVRKHAGIVQQSWRRRTDNLRNSGTTSNENWIDGCKYAFITLTSGLAALAQRRSNTLREQENFHPNTDGDYYRELLV